MHRNLNACQSFSFCVVSNVSCIVREFFQGISNKKNEEKFPFIEKFCIFAPQIAQVWSRAFAVDRPNGVSQTSIYKNLSKGALTHILAVGIVY